MNDGTSSDDIIDERIRSLAAGHFNAPEGEPPRQAMWEGIAAARRAARAAHSSTNADSVPTPRAPTTIEVTPLVPRRSHAAAWRWGAALAAGLVLGIVVDRRLVGDSPASKPTEIASRGPVASSPIAPAPTRDTTRAPVGSTPAPSQRELAIHAPNAKGSARTAPSTVDRDDSRPLASRGATDSTTQALYRAAAAQTLVQAEALLTAYRADEGARDPQSMQQAARWARDVLSSTRLLIDSPAGRDPQMRALFTDLELILAQLVQLSGTPLQANERELIERAMRERDLLPRLRSAVPAGLAAS